MKGILKGVLQQKNLTVCTLLICKTYNYVQYKKEHKVFHTNKNCQDGKVCHMVR